MNWCVYVILCGDGSLYCGISNNVQVRWLAHQLGKGARYTRMRGVQEMRVLACDLSHSDAAKFEYAFKQLTRTQKWDYWHNGVIVQAASS